MISALASAALQRNFMLAVVPLVVIGIATSKIVSSRYRYHFYPLVALSLMITVILGETAVPSNLSIVDFTNTTLRVRIFIAEFGEPAIWRTLDTGSVEEWLNVTMYLIPAATAYLIFRNAKAIFIAGSILSFAIELWQAVMSGRDASPVDFATNTFGVCAGLLIASASKATLRRIPKNTDHTDHLTIRRFPPSQPQQQTGSIDDPG